MLTRAAGRLSMMFRSSSSFSAGYFSHKPTAYNNDNTPFEFTEDNYGEVQRILSKYPEKHKRSAIIPLLMLAQKQNDNFLSLNAMRKVAKIVEVNEMDIYEVSDKLRRWHLSTPCSIAKKSASSICRSVAPRHACFVELRISLKHAKNTLESRKITQLLTAYLRSKRLNVWVPVRMPLWYKLTVNGSTKIWHRKTLWSCCRIWRQEGRRKVHRLIETMLRALKAGRVSM